jgi:hypothetical protein
MISGRKLESLLFAVGRRMVGRFDDGYNAESFASLLVSMGAHHISVFNGEGDHYGMPGPPIPPREEGGALPGLGIASGGWAPGSVEEKRYVAASKAWMHANCAADPETRRVWREVLELFRQGKWPDDLE